MKKTIKIMSILLVTIMFVAIFATNVNATGADSILNKMSNVNYSDKSGIGDVGKNIVNILSTIGVVVAVIILLIIGIKYMVKCIRKSRIQKENDSILSRCCVNIWSICNSKGCSIYGSNNYC